MTPAVSSFKALVKPSQNIFQLTGIPVATAAQSQHFLPHTFRLTVLRTKNTPPRKHRTKSFPAASRPSHPSIRHNLLNTLQLASTLARVPAPPSTLQQLQSSPSHTRNYQNVVHSFRCICPGSPRGRTIRQHHCLPVDATLCHCRLQP
jgi:hypothetical protein